MTTKKVTIRLNPKTGVHSFPIDEKTRLTRKPIEVSSAVAKNLVGYEYKVGIPVAIVVEGSVDNTEDETVTEESASAENGG